MFKLGKNTTRNLETLAKSGRTESLVLIEAVKGFIHVTPIDFCVLYMGGYRSASEQNDLYKDGKSQCDGYHNRSFHQDGLAVDLVPWVDGKPIWDDKHAFYLSGAFMGYCSKLGLDITSGADWNRDGNLKDGWDPCHMQIEEKA